MSPPLGIEPGTTPYTIARSVVTATERFLSEAGELGNEGVAAWIGALDEHGANVTRAYIPAQIPYRGPEGVSVRIPEAAITRLIAALEPDERVLMRVHSHPTFAYHSDLDDLNMLISHAGAISCVVPYFARNGIHLPICSLNELQSSGDWHELPVDEVERRFRIQ